MIYTDCTNTTRNIQARGLARQPPLGGSLRKCGACVRPVYYLGPVPSPPVSITVIVVMVQLRLVEANAIVSMAKSPPSGSETVVIVNAPPNIDIAPLGADVIGRLDGGHCCAELPPRV